jgi:hypothetical protein
MSVAVITSTAQASDFAREKLIQMTRGRTHRMSASAYRIKSSTDSIRRCGYYPSETMRPRPSKNSLIQRVRQVVACKRFLLRLRS